MNLCRFFLVVIVMTFYFAQAKYQPPYEQEKAKVEEMYKKIHPDLESLYDLDWDLADNITQERLEKVCRDVAIVITPTFLVNQTTYIPPTMQERSLHMEKVVRYAPVLFSVGGMKYMTLIRCTFEELEFYLAQGPNENQVFCLRKDKVDHIYYFRSGLHDIRTRVLDKVRALTRRALASMSTVPRYSPCKQEICVLGKEIVRVDLTNTRIHPPSKYIMYDEDWV